MAKNKVISLILSAVVAFGMWLYVVTVVSPESQETFRNIPVTIQGDGVLRDRGLMIVENKNPTVTLRISGNRTELVKLNESNITITADVSKIYEAGEHSVKFSYSFPGDVAESSLVVEERHPDSLSIVVENRVSKPVDVEVIYRGEPAQGFFDNRDNVELDYPQITVTGPESLVGSDTVEGLIAKAVVYVDLSGRTESFRESFSYALCDADGEPVDVSSVTTNVDAVTVQMQIYTVKEVELKVNVIPGGGATQENSTVEINPKTVSISGSKAQLENIDEIIIGTIQLGKIPEDMVLNFDILMAEGITNQTGIHKAIVSVRFPDMLTKTLEVSKIRTVNTADKKVELITQVLPITVRGPKELVEKLTSASVIVTVDFKDVPLGTTTVPAQITFSGEFAELGAVGDYTVSATLSE